MDRVCITERLVDAHFGLPLVHTVYHAATLPKWNVFGVFSCFLSKTRNPFRFLM